MFITIVNYTPQVLFSYMLGIQSIYPSVLHLNKFSLCWTRIGYGKLVLWCVLFSSSGWTLGSCLNQNTNVLQMKPAFTWFENLAFWLKISCFQFGLENCLLLNNKNKILSSMVGCQYYHVWWQWTLLFWSLMESICLFCSAC